MQQQGHHRRPGFEARLNDSSLDAGSDLGRVHFLLGARAPWQFNHTPQQPSPITHATAHPINQMGLPWCDQTTHHPSGPPRQILPGLFGIERAWVSPTTTIIIGSLYIYIMSKITASIPSTGSRGVHANPSASLKKAWTPTRRRFRWRRPPPPGRPCGPRRPTRRGPGEQQSPAPPPQEEEGARAGVARR